MWPERKFLAVVHCYGYKRWVEEEIYRHESDENLAVEWRWKNSLKLSQKVK